MQLIMQFSTLMLILGVTHSIKQALHAELVDQQRQHDSINERSSLFLTNGTYESLIEEEERLTFKAELFR
jgi:hypothetical protein